MPYPVLVNNTSYPLSGIDENGNLLSDLITQNGGSLPINEWYEPVFDKYFNTLSGGVYTVDFEFAKPSSTTRFMADSLAVYSRANGNSYNSIVWNKWQMIANDVAEDMFNYDNNIFDNVDCIHFTFEGLPKNIFHATPGGGTVFFNVTLQKGGQTFYSGKPISIQLGAGAIPHERLHVIGAISGYPSGFDGFRDRGRDRSTGNSHYNMLWSYDMMFHDPALLDQHSLYGFPPLLSHDLIFFGWIKPEEILDVNSTNFTSYDLLKLKDVVYPLTSTEISQGYRRVIRVMIKENYSGDLDEYFLIEYHNASEFDKAFTNYDEYQTNGYNKGILIWHIKETTNRLYIGADNQIDLEVAVPYNGWNGNPIPNTSFPRDYNRPDNVGGMSVWNGNYARDFDYLDDNFMYYSGGYWR